MANLNITNGISTNGVDLASFNLQNAIQINQFVFGGEVICNGDGVNSITLNVYDMSDIELSTFNAPAVNGGGVLGHYREQRDINIEFLITKDTKQEFQQKVDEVKTSFSKTEANFDWLYNGRVRRVRASLTSFDRIERISDNSARFRAVIRSMDPDWEEISPVFKIYEDVSANYQVNIDNDGSQPTDMDVYVIYKGSSSVTKTSVIVNGVGITTDAPFVAGDVLIVDSNGFRFLNKDVTIDFDGIFPLLNRGANIVSFDFEGTVEADITAVYYNRYS